MKNVDNYFQGERKVYVPSFVLSLPLLPLGRFKSFVTQFPPTIRGLVIMVREHVIIKKRICGIN